MTGGDERMKDAGPPTEWDAASCHRLSAPQFSWGKGVLERLLLSGDETPMDADRVSDHTRLFRGVFKSLKPGGPPYTLDYCRLNVSARRPKAI